MYTEAVAGDDIHLLHSRLFSGAILRFAAFPQMAEVVSYTRGFLEDRLAPHRPEQIHLMPGDLAARCAALQREYSSAAGTRQAWKALFEAVGLEPHAAMRDRLMLRFQPPVADDRPWARSTATVGFHRDTWGTNLYAQVNWWAPVYPITAGRTFAFLPELFARPLRNNSEQFDIAAIIRRNRGQGAPVVRGEMVPQLLEEIDVSAARPVVIEPHELILFSSQHAHVGVPNRTDLTRISLETRTLRLADLAARRGAPNVDGRAKWISWGMFRRIADDRPLPEVLGVQPCEPFHDAMSARAGQDD